MHHNLSEEVHNAASSKSMASPAPEETAVAANSGCGARVPIRPYSTLQGERLLWGVKRRQFEQHIIGDRCCRNRRGSKCGTGPHYTAAHKDTPPDCPAVETAEAASTWDNRVLMRKPSAMDIYIVLNTLGLHPQRKIGFNTYARKHMWPTDHCQWAVREQMFVLRFQMFWETFV